MKRGGTPNALLLWDLRDPNGVIQPLGAYARNEERKPLQWSYLPTSGAFDASPDVWRIPASGQYAIVVSGQNGATGAYSFTLWDAPSSAPTSITYGQTVNGQLASPGVEDQFTFHGAAGDTVRFTVNDAHPGWDWKLRDPHGFLVDWVRDVTDGGP